MIDAIVKIMSKLEKIAMDYYYDSHKSEQLRERQKRSLDVLKHKQNESAQKNMNEDTKRGPDINV